MKVFAILATAAALASASAIPIISKLVPMTEGNLCINDDAGQACAKGLECSRDDSLGYAVCQAAGTRARVVRGGEGDSAMASMSSKTSGSPWTKGGLCVPNHAELTCAKGSRCSQASKDSLWTCS